MGKDKVRAQECGNISLVNCELTRLMAQFENEDLIKYAYPEDVWFHVDKLSSAHVDSKPYTRSGHGR